MIGSRQRCRNCMELSRSATPGARACDGPGAANSTTARSPRRRLAARCPAPARREDGRARIAGARSSRAEPVNRDTSQPWPAPPTVDEPSTVARPVYRWKDVLREALTAHAPSDPVHRRVLVYRRACMTIFPPEAPVLVSCRAVRGCLRAPGDVRDGWLTGRVWLAVRCEQVLERGYSGMPGRRILHGRNGLRPASWTSTTGALMDAGQQSQMQRKGKRTKRVGN